MFEERLLKKMFVHSSNKLLFFLQNMASKITELSRIFGILVDLFLVLATKDIPFKELNYFCILRYLVQPFCSSEILFVTSDSFCHSVPELRQHLWGTV